MTDTPQDNIIRFPGVVLPNAFVLRVDLVLAPRPIWRTLQVAENATFWDLHVALQDVMGWRDCHLHVFTVDHPHTGERLRIGVPDASEFHGSNAVIPGWQVQVRDIIRPDYPPILYTYDLGDQWQHEIALEAVLPADEAGPSPRCLGGEGACPPEDCGGTAGYTRLLTSLSAAASEEREMIAMWLEPGFDAAAFDPDAVRFCDPARRWHEVFDTES